MSSSVLYQITEVDPTSPLTKGKVYQVHKVTAEEAPQIGGKTYNAIMIKDPDDPLVSGKVYQVTFIDDPTDPTVKGKVYNAIVEGGGTITIVGPAVSPLDLPDAVANSLSYVKAYGGTKQGLPGGYTPLEYIEMTGAQYLDTGITGYANTNVLKTKINASQVSATCFITFQNPSSGADNLGLFLSSSRWTFQYGSPSQVSSLASANTDVSIEATNGVLKINGVSVTGTAASEFSISEPVLIGTAINGTTVEGRKFQGKIYYFSWEDSNGNVLFNGIPAKDSNNVAGMYDTVSGRFLTNQGTGDITAGPAITPTPDAPMDIVSNNGVLKLSPNLFNKNLVPDVNEYINRSTGSLSIPTAGEFRHSDYIEIKKGTQYYVGIINSVASSAGLAFYDDTKTYLSGISLTQLASDNNIITSPNYTKYIRFSFRIDGKYNTDWENTVYLVEGNQPLTEFIPYGIYTDGTVETINVHGKNLFDKDDSTNWGGWYPANGVIAQSTSANRTLAMRCQPNTTYYFKHCTYVGGLRAFCVETETWGLGTPVALAGGSAKDDANVVYSFTTTPNAKWLFALFGRNDAATTATFEQQASDYILSTEVLTSDTPYEPYYNGGTATAQMLLKVGDYQDVQSIIDGVVTRNVGVKVFDGTEIFVNGSNGWITEAAITDQADAVYLPFCTHFVGTDTTPVAASNTVRVYRTSGGVGCVYFGVDKTITEFSTKLLFQQWVADQYAAGTPVIIVYPLATATTESVAGQTLQVQAGDNTLEITQASLSGLELEAEYTKAS